jgi:hypothetical protein
MQTFIYLAQLASCGTERRTILTAILHQALNSSLMNLKNADQNKTDSNHNRLDTLGKLGLAINRDDPSAPSWACLYSTKIRDHAIVQQWARFPTNDRRSSLFLAASQRACLLLSVGLKIIVVGDLSKPLYQPPHHWIPFI